MVERTVDLEARDVTQGADKDARDVFLKRPLHLAVSESHLSGMLYMYEQGGDKEARDVSDWTPLHMAAHSGHLSVMQYLCE